MVSVKLVIAFALVACALADPGYLSSYQQPIITKQVIPVVTKQVVPVVTKQVVPVVQYKQVYSSYGGGYGGGYGSSYGYH